MNFDPADFRHTMRLWATGVTIVSTTHEELMLGMTVSSFTSVTLEPPLILICLQKETATAAAIIETGRFAVSMLGEGAEEISNRFAGLTEMKEEENRFDGLKLHFAATGAPILADAMGWLDCKLNATHDGSTHHIFLGEVVAASGEGDHSPAPLLYYNREYRRLV